MDVVHRHTEVGGSLTPNLTYSVLGGGAGDPLSPYRHDGAPAVNLGADGIPPGGVPTQDTGAFPDYDLSDFTRFIPYPGELRQAPLWEVVVKIVFYTFIMAVAILGNLAVVIIVARNKRMHTTTNFYIVNLAVSDLMVTLTCTWVHLVDDLTEGWVMGAFFCKMDSFAQVFSLVSSVLTLTLIACDRFFGIVFAMKAHLTERRALPLIVVIWVISVGMSTPLLFYRHQFSRVWSNHVEIWCGDTWPAKGQFDPVANMSVVTHPSRTFYYTFISIVLYFIPVVIMTFAYTLIIWKLWRKQPPGERIDTEVSVQTRLKKKVIMMLLMILFVFAFCWLPFQVAILYSEHRSQSNTALPPWYEKFNFFAAFMAFANSAFNPVIYTAFNGRFRRGFRDTFTMRTNRHEYWIVGSRSDVRHQNTISKV